MKDREKNGRLRVFVCADEGATSTLVKHGYVWMGKGGEGSGCWRLVGV